MSLCREPFIFLSHNMKLSREPDERVSTRYVEVFHVCICGTLRLPSLHGLVVLVAKTLVLVEAVRG